MKISQIDFEHLKKQSIIKENLDLEKLAEKKDDIENFNDFENLIQNDNEQDLVQLTKKENLFKKKNSEKILLEVTGKEIEEDIKIGIGTEQKFLNDTENNNEKNEQSLKVEKDNFEFLLESENEKDEDSNDDDLEEMKKDRSLENINQNLSKEEIVLKSTEDLKNNDINKSKLLKFEFNQINEIEKEKNQNIELDFITSKNHIIVEQFNEKQKVDKTKEIINLNIKKKNLAFKKNKVSTPKFEMAHPKI